MNSPISNPVKHQQILRDLRERIVTGTLPPDHRLPTRRDLARQYDAGPMTVQRALDHLLRDGLVVSRGRSGTFVSSHVPHLYRYALVFPSFPQQSLQTQALVQAAERITAAHAQAGLGKRISLYFGVDGRPDSEDYQRLAREVRTHTVAGLIFAGFPIGLNDTPLLQESNIPRVALMAEHMLPQVAAVAHDFREMIDRSVGILAQQGRKRIGLIAQAMPGQAMAHAREQNFIESVRRHGMEARPYWADFLHAECPWTVERTIQLWTRLPVDDRPDGLLILDDNFVDDTTRALAAAVWRVPQEVGVIAHANFPLRLRTAVPVTAVGFDAARVLRVCMELVDAQRRGETVAPVTKIPAVTEEEVVWWNP